jgi:DnaK suppressor protein
MAKAKDTKAKEVKKDEVKPKTSKKVEKEETPKASTATKKEVTKATETVKPLKGSVEATPSVIADKKESKGKKSEVVVAEKKVDVKKDKKEVKEDKATIVEPEAPIEEKAVPVVVETPKPAKSSKKSDAKSKKVKSEFKMEDSQELKDLKTPTPKAVKREPVVEEVVVPKPMPNVKYGDEDLAMFKAKIQDARKDALEELQMLKERLDDLTSADMAEESMIYSMHMAEQGSEAIEKEKTYAQMTRINEYLKKLDEALTRIEDKTYGICRVCGCLIAKERLLAVPITTLSASYKIQKKCPEDGIDRIEPLRK